MHPQTPAPWRAIVLAQGSCAPAAQRASRASMMNVLAMRLETLQAAVILLR